MKVSKTKKLALITGSICMILTTFVLADALVIPKTYIIVENLPRSSNTVVPAVITEYAYKDKDIAISISTITEDDLIYHVADIRISDVQYLKSAFAKDIYGKNVLETTSKIAQKNQAILAFNGDFYGLRDEGLIIRNGILYRDEPRQAPDNRALLIDDKGNFIFVTEGFADGASSVDQGIIHSLSLGPVLVEDGKAMKIDSRLMDAEGPRTAIGMIRPLHYLLIVVDGSSEDSKGMRLDVLAKLFVKLKAVSAYNLSGGGSSTLWFNGKIINNPATIGFFSDERPISDILFVGY
jgi:exopolysaccharide biosynthesis protein